MNDNPLSGEPYFSAWVFDEPVRAGDPVSLRTFAGHGAAAQRNRLFAGPGVRLQSMPGGTIVSFDGNAALWPHPFRVSLGGNSAVVRAGLVNGIMPKIGTVPLDAATGAPRLSWTKPKLDKTGRGWLALEVTLGEEWEVTAATIVQVADLDHDAAAAAPPPTPAGYSSGGSLTLPGRRARHPLALLRQRDSGALVAFQTTHFNLAHRVAVAPSGDRGRHFFFPG